MNPRLIEILRTMDVPVFRKGDIPWLSRNLHIHNRNHPDLKEAMELIKKELQNGR